MVGLFLYIIYSLAIGTDMEHHTVSILVSIHTAFTAVSLHGLDSLQACQYVMWCLMTVWTNIDTAVNISPLKSYSIQFIFTYIASVVVIIVCRCFTLPYFATYDQIFYNIKFVLDMIRITFRLHQITQVPDSSCSHWRIHLHLFSRVCWGSS